MGFYLRKSIRVGPFRFNLSKSGLGVSAGVKGLRVGISPRGNYVHMGANGLYYRTTLPKSSKEKLDEVSENNQNDSELDLTNSATHETLKEIESADITQIVDSSSADLLNELNSKKNKSSTWPFVLALFLFLSYIAYVSTWPQWTIALIAAIGCVLTWVSHTRDLLAKTAVLFYDFEPEMEAAYTQLLNAADRLCGCTKVWHISASGRVLDRKYHAGASDIVQRKDTAIQVVEPPYLKTNIKSVAIAVGQQTLHFFPDRVLVYDVNGIGAVSYQDLLVSVNEQRFIEDGSVPRDARIIDKTWKYVNKSGGPDRRFKDNHELPICLYEEMSFTSHSGLNELIQLSACGNAQVFEKALLSLARCLPKEVECRINAA